MKVKSLILTGFGINCEVETGAAYRRAGADVHIVHINDIFNGKTDITDYDILNFPGGFSFGDDIGSGKVMANKIKFKKTAGGKTLMEQIGQFLERGKYILGICNGFQMLVQLGLLPDTEKKWNPEVALIHNDSGKFEDRWVKLKINGNNPSPFLRGMDFLALPVRHGEGKLVFRDENIRRAVHDKNLIAMQYVDDDGHPASHYPDNPNGSTDSIAALTDESGQILGMMPHPEAFLQFHNHFNWPALKINGKIIPREKTGQVIFDNIVNHIQKHKG